MKRVYITACVCRVGGGVRCFQRITALAAEPPRFGPISATENRHPHPMSIPALSRSIRGSVSHSPYIMHSEEANCCLLLVDFQLESCLRTSRAPPLRSSPHLHQYPRFASTGPNATIQQPLHTRKYQEAYKARNKALLYYTTAVVSMHGSTRKKQRALTTTADILCWWRIICRGANVQGVLLCDGI